jgi:hypothetical protein
MKATSARLFWGAVLALLLMMQVPGCLPSPQYMVAVAVEGGGRVSLPAEPAGQTAPFTGGALPEGTELVLTATADNGYCFVRWEGDVPPGNDPEDREVCLTVTSDLNVTAVFRAVAGHRYVTADGVTGHMTLAVEGSTAKGVWRHLDLGLDVDGTITGNDVVLTCSAPFTTSATITATIASDGSWNGTIHGSGFEHGAFTAEPVELAGSGEGSAALRTVFLPDYGAAAVGRLAVVAEDGILKGTWRLVGNLGADIEGTVANDRISFSVNTPGLSSASATATVQADGSWEGTLAGSGFEGDRFEAEPPFFP